MAAAPIDPTITCSRCQNTLDTTGNPQWCKKCRAAYKREYEATKKEMQESRGYAAGVSAAKDYFAKKFGALGASSFTGTEIAFYIRQAQGPFD